MPHFHKFDRFLATMFCAEGAAAFKRAGESAHLLDMSSHQLCARLVSILGERLNDLGEMRDDS